MPKKNSPAKLLRSVKRMTKFLERKRYVNIAPARPKLSICHAESTSYFPDDMDLATILPQSPSDLPTKPK